LFVAPSRQEGFGLTPLEAMASQTAVVTSDAGSFPSMIKPGVNGAIVPAGDADALADAIEPYLRDPNLAKEQGRAALEFVHANFSLAAEARGIRAVYDRLWTKGQKPISLPRKGQPNAGKTEPAGGPNETGYQYASGVDLTFATDVAANLQMRISNPKLHWKHIFASGSLIPTFAKVLAEKGCEC
jgi:hypothetical protein